MSKVREDKRFTYSIGTRKFNPAKIKDVRDVRAPNMIWLTDVVHPTPIGHAASPKSFPCTRVSRKQRYRGLQHNRGYGGRAQGLPLNNKVSRVFISGRASHASKITTTLQIPGIPSMCPCFIPSAHLCLSPQVPTTHQATFSETIDRKSVV